jgi:glycine dehydrogenase subunit 2
LIVDEALMIEPTETETKDTLDDFAAAIEKIIETARTDPDSLHEAPAHLPVTRMDVVSAARNPVLRWKPGLEK